MLKISEKECLHWFVIHTHPKQEGRAESNLKAWNVETFFPKLSERKFKANRKAKRVLKPLFPRYFFARFIASDLLHKVRFTRGVYDVVSCGGNPSPVDNEIISTIQSRVGEDGAIKLDDELQPGVQVRIEDGPFKNFVAKVKLLADHTWQEL